MVRVSPWAKFLARVSLGNMLPEFSADTVESPFGELLLITRWVIPVDADIDDDVSQPTFSKVRVCYPAPKFTEDMAAARYLRDLIAGNLQHELSENFRLDGKRIFDPHTGGQ